MDYGQNAKTARCSLGHKHLGFSENEKKGCKHKLKAVIKNISVVFIRQIVQHAHLHVCE